MSNRAATDQKNWSPDPTGLDQNPDYIRWRTQQFPSSKTNVIFDPIFAMVVGRPRNESGSARTVATLMSNIQHVQSSLPSQLPRLIDVIIPQVRVLVASF